MTAMATGSMPTPCPAVRGSNHPTLPAAGRRPVSPPVGKPGRCFAAGPGCSASTDPFEVPQWRGMAEKHHATGGTVTDETVAVGVDDRSLRSLRRWNLGLTVLHAAQAVAVLVLGGTFAISVTAAFPQGPPGAAAAAPETLVDVRISIVIAVFLLLAALDHGLTATALRDRYERDLAAGINRFRWLEYSLSATLMIWLICLYSGITDVAALLGIGGANTAMILFGWIQERMNPPARARTAMMPFWFGTVAGLAPWLAIAVLVIGAETVPGFVVAIFVSLLVFFASFGINQWLQYRGIGPWRSYGFGERAYLVLSLVAKSALAWQIFAGSLVS